MTEIRDATSPDWMAPVLRALDPARPVLIAGPTASGKSALAMAIARARGGTIVNADALQVYADWRILTARPSAADEAACAHALYGHVPGDRPYSVGDWLRDLRPHLGKRDAAPIPAPIIVGGTGLNFTALTEGLAEIPPTPPEIRRAADTRRRAEGHQGLLAELDPETAAGLDPHNPMRVQRAWEVLRATGRGLAAWHRETGPPLLPLSDTQAIVLQADRDWLAERIARRFDLMLAAGLLDEARANAPSWSPDRPSAKAIGAAELMAHLDGTLPRDALRDAVSVLTRQYAKRQRSWFRARMKAWTWIACD